MSYPDIRSLALMTDSLADSEFYAAGVEQTPLLFSSALSEMTGCEVYLKCEHQQATGSFKLRGATSALLHLAPSDRKDGVVAASSGNHGLAVTFAGARLSVGVEVFVPDNITEQKARAITDAGGSLHKVAGNADDAELAARAYAQRRGKPYLSPYNDAAVIVGQGTVVRECMQQQSALQHVFCSVGGGGLASGTGAYLAVHAPDTLLHGAWPAASTAMLASMRAGEVVETPESDTLSDGTAGGLEPDCMTLPLCRQLVRSTDAVSEVEIARAMQLLYQLHGFMVEGAAGVALASFIRQRDCLTGQKVAIILCGGNIAPARFHTVLSQLPQSQA